MASDIEWTRVARILTRPFSDQQVKYRAGATTKDKTRAMALAYVDARDVMERLDEAVGSRDWHDSYRLMSDVAVECSLTVLGVTKTDVGYPNSEDDEEPLKSAYSDALKRAAVKFGIGRDLYAMPTRWVPYDADHKRLILDSAPPEPERPQARAASSPALPAHTERVVAAEREPEAVRAAFAAFGDEIEQPPLELGVFREGEVHLTGHKPLRLRANGSLYCPTKIGDDWCTFVQKPMAAVR